ncbi:MAG: diguanylate cyclase domain-containing protein [Ruminococcus sp.]
MAGKGDKNERHAENLKRLKISMILGYAAIVVAAILFVSLLAVQKTDEVLKNKVSTMASSLNVQMKLNMDSYLSRMETIGTLVFASEEAYTYDATAEGLDEYEALNTEKIISDELYSLCIMENFVDYGIVYRNNHTVGKISNGTVDLFGDQLYADLEEKITRQRTKDGWFTGYHDNFKRIYYVKRVHENALLVISFYASELENVFDNPETLKDMDIRLTEQNHKIIYSSREDETGMALPDAIHERVENRNSSTVMDDEYLVTVNSCGDSWYVICSIPTQIILNEKNEMRLYIYVAAIAAALLAILMGTILSIKLTDPVSTIVTNLNTKAHIDQLTGILNKRSFEEYTENALHQALPVENHALILLDVDNFKGVNDTLGHAYGDQVLAEIGNILRTVFQPEDYLGRIGGDEFCVLLNTEGLEQDYLQLVCSKCEKLCEAFHNNYTGDDGTYKISASIGVSLFPIHGDSFAKLYKRADRALYVSKKKGKDTYTIYEVSHDGEEAGT